VGVGWARKGCEEEYIRNGDNLYALHWHERRSAPLLHLRFGASPRGTRYTNIREIVACLVPRPPHLIPIAGLICPVLGLQRHDDIANPVAKHHMYMPPIFSPGDMFCGAIYVLS